jgi:hypothetical protein
MRYPAFQSLGSVKREDPAGTPVWISQVGEMGFNSRTLILEGQRILDVWYVGWDSSQISFGLPLHIDKDGAHWFGFDCSDGNPVDKKKVVGSPRLKRELPDGNT